MEPVSLFSLERHDDPYEKWPLRTRLFVNGAPSRTAVPGYVLLHQFLTDCGYLLVTDCDCPFEEATHVVLLDRATLKITSCRQFSAPYGSFNLDSFEWIDRRSARISFHKDGDWLLTLRSRGIPFLLPRLRVQRLGAKTEGGDA